LVEFVVITDIISPRYCNAYDENDENSPNLDGFTNGRLIDTEWPVNNNKKKES
jgi:hypothetical protein